MAKTIICPSGTQVVGNNVLVSYTASVIGPPNFSYGTDYQVNTGISVAANLVALKTKIIAEVLTKGVTIIDTDIIMFGIPT